MTVTAALADRPPNRTPNALTHLAALADAHHAAWFGHPIPDGPLGEKELNTVGYVTSRYGPLPDNELAEAAEPDGLHARVAADPQHAPIPVFQIPPGRL